MDRSLRQSKLQIPGLSYNWWGFQAWDTVQDSIDNSSIGKAETSLEWQVYFSQFQYRTGALPCRIHLPVCLWIMDSHSRAPKKNTSHGNEVLSHDTAHLIQRPCYQRGSPCQDPADNRTAQRPPDHHSDANCSGIVMSPVHQVWPKQSCKAQWKGEEGNAERGRSGKTMSGNGQAWSLPSPSGQWKTGEHGGNWLWNHLWSPQRPSRLKDRWWWWWWWW